MYEAIVFLPLLGAVIAGAIALIGARNRLPGADPPPPGDHAAPHVDESHGHAAPSLHGALDE
jgi:NADH-quinone oxidoreductase subunit L